MKKLNRTCICCGEKYSYCPSCGADINKPSWMTIYHNANCRSIFNTASDFLAKEITKEQAKEQFQNCDLSYKNKLHHKIVEAIDIVYGKKNQGKSVIRHDEKENNLDSDLV